MHHAPTKRERRPSAHLRAVLPVLLVIAATVACGDTRGRQDDVAEPGGTADTYTAGMERVGISGTYRVRLVDAVPAPPDKGDNVWRLRVLDSSGSTAEGVTVALAPFMPNHGHGTTPATFPGSPTTESGTFEVGPFDLFMPGLWEMTVHVADGSGAEDEVVFRFRIEG